MNLLVSFCCNDPAHGEPTGFLEQIALPEELLTLEGPHRDSPPFAGTTSFELGRDRLRIAERSYSHAGVSRWLGNFCWDAALLAVADVARMLNELPRGQWPVTVGEMRLFDRWRAGQPIRAADILKAMEA